jgi:hypothetical protein
MLELKPEGICRRKSLWQGTNDATNGDGMQGVMFLENIKSNILSPHQRK